MTTNFEKNELYKEVLNWIEENDSHFKEYNTVLDDNNNLERIKRFAGSPIEYIDERIELNKEVLKNYHKLHHSILLAGFTGFFAIILSQSILRLVETITLTHIPWRYVFIIALLFIGAFIAIKVHITYLILEWIGLLRVIRDSEIEIFYLSKIKEYRFKSE